MDTWISKMVRIKSTRRIVACAVLLAFVAIFGFFQLRYIRNFLQGPYELGARELDAIANVNMTPRYFAKVNGTRVIDTNLKEYSVDSDSGAQTFTGGYYALDLGNRFLICRSVSGPATSYIGELAPMKGEFSRKFFKSKEMKSLQNRFYPFYLDTDSFRVQGYIALGAFLVFGIFLGIVFRSSRKHLKDPFTHPAYQRVQNWGNPVNLAVALEREAASPRFKGRNGWLVTDHYLIRSSFFTFDLLRISDLLWAHKKVTRHSINFIPTGKTHEAVLKCMDGNAAIPAKEATINAMLEFLSRQAPWAIFGYSKDLAQQFKANPEAFRAAVIERRREGSQPQHKTGERV